MPIASISGLASGLDTATIIKQLMQIESNSQTLLKQRVGSEKISLSSLRTVNSKVAAIIDKAGTLSDSASWSALKASSSSDQVTVKAGPTAFPSDLTFTVNQTATSHRLSFTNTAALTDPVTVPGTTLVRLDTLDGTTVDIDTGDGTLNGLVNAINGSDAGVAASIVKVADNSYRLNVTSTSTGVLSDFTLTNLDGSALLGGASITAGQDAQITVGTDLITSSSNTFTGLMPGSDVTIASTAVAGTKADITVSRDPSSTVNSVKALVDAANSALSDITSLTAYNSSTSSAGLLAGDPVLRELRNQILSAVTAGVGGQSLATVGIQLDRTGTLIFDSAKFTDAYVADPAVVAAKFTAADGFAVRMNTIATGASDSVVGSISTTIMSKDTTIDRLNDDIANWDIRLELRRTTLTRQFTALETAMNQMQSQSSWLAGLFAGLPQTSSKGS